MDDLGIRFANFGNNFFVKVNDIVAVIPLTNRYAKELLRNADDLGTCIKASNSKTNTLILLEDGRVIASGFNPSTVIQRINEAIVTPMSELPVRTAYTKRMDDMNVLSDDDPDEDESGSVVYNEPVDPAADVDDDEVELPRRRGRRKKDEGNKYALRDSVYVDNPA